LTSSTVCSWPTCFFRLFSSPTSSITATPSPRKRGALPLTEISAAIVKSSPVPISDAEAIESVNMLTKLYPFFIKSLNVDGEEWFEMPSSPAVEKDEDKRAPPSPSSPRKGKGREPASAEEVLTRSPKRVRKEGGGLREVRERIRRELDQALKTSATSADMWGPTYLVFVGSVEYTCVPQQLIPPTADFHSMKAEKTKFKELLHPGDPGI
jgi:hypothetical protein